MHRIVGRVYLTTMVLAAGSSFALRDIMDPSYKERWYEDGSSDNGKQVSQTSTSGIKAALENIFTLRGLGPVHLLSAGVLVSLPMGILAARAGNINRHAFIMRLNFFGLAAVSRYHHSSLLSDLTCTPPGC
jgi:uncharacterized membrane protein